MNAYLNSRLNKRCTLCIVPELVNKGLHSIIAKKMYQSIKQRDKKSANKVANNLFAIVYQ